VLGLQCAAGFPGQRFVIAASTYDLLRDRQIAKVHTEFQGMGEYHADHKIHGRCYIFNDKNLGVICFRNLDDPGKYRGTECCGAGVEELTELPAETMGEPTLSTLMYPIRSPLPLPLLPLVGVSNPDGIGWQWVKQIWVDRDLEPFKLTSEQAIFVQALIDDNPFATPEMVANLDRLTGHLYESRRLGKWDAPQGARWPVLDRRVHSFKFKEKWPYGLPEGLKIIMGLDWGKRAPYCALWFIIDPDGDIYLFREDYQAGLDTHVQAQRVKNMTGGNEYVNVVRADRSMWNATQKEGTVEPGRPLISYFEDELGRDMRFGGFEKGYNRHRATALDTIDKVLNRDNGYPNLYIEESCINTWKELSGAIWDTRGMLSGKREDLDPRSADHAITAMYYALHAEIDPYEGDTDEEVTPQMSRAAQIRQTYEHSFERLRKRRPTFFGRRA
jgi:hypothetical protein